MTENSPGSDTPAARPDERATSLHDALVESQRQERDERNAELARQQAADDRIVEALSTSAPDSPDAAGTE